MVSTTLPELKSSIKSPEADLDTHSQLIANEGTLVIRLGLDGIDSVEIEADESELEVQLLDLWTSVRPALDVAMVNAERCGERIR